MSSSTCDKTWLVEALRDERVMGDERETAELHVASCDACRSERRALDRLASRLEAGLPDTLDASALRDGIMEHVVRSASRPPRTRARAVTLAAVATLALVAVVAFVFLRPHPVLAVATVHSLGPGARFIHAVAASSETIRIDEGTVRVEVKREGNPRRVTVLVPDGEIEDVGTIFDVDVAGGHLKRVRVADGAVILRLSGAPPVAVAKGELWERDESRTNASAPPLPATPPIDPTEPVVDRPVRSLAASNAKPAAATPSGAPSSRADESSDGTAEDAAYLHIVSLVRAGRRDEARAAAKDYLLRFPNGFRREEVGAVAR